MKNRYHATAIVFGLLFLLVSCRKKTDTTAFNYASKIVGTRMYHGSCYGKYYTRNDSGIIIATDYYYEVNEPATITRINDTAYQFFEDTIWLKPIMSQHMIDTVNKKIVFTLASHVLTYFYSADSIRFEFHDFGVSTDNNRVLSSP